MKIIINHKPHRVKNMIFGQFSNHSEFVECFENTNIKTLLIRGAPGSGKTLLALSLTSLHQGEFFYVSMRVSPDDLLETYSWLRTEIENLRVLDVSREIAITDETGKIVDRGDDLSSLVLSMKYGDRPSFLRSLLTLLRNTTNPLVVIDSLEAVQECIEMEILRDLLEISSELDIRMIFIVERDEMGKEDYLVDGVIELRREIVDEGVIRMMIIHKLRGCNIPQPSYLFTLKNGRFRLFEPFSYEMPEEPRLFEPLEDPDEDTFSSGSRSLDEIFGGFRKGSSILLEVGKGVTREMYHRFIQTFKFNFLRKGRKVYQIPTLGTDKKWVEREMAPFLREEELRNLRWVERGWGRERLSEDEAREEASRIYERLAYEERIGSYEDLHITGVDSVYSRYGKECITDFEQGNAFVQDTRGLRIRTAKPGFPLMKELSNLNDIHIKMENICGVPVIRGLKPKTQFYAMVVDISRGYPRVEFEKVE